MEPFPAPVYTRRTIFLRRTLLEHVTAFFLIASVHAYNAICDRWVFLHILSRDSFSREQHSVTELAKHVIDLHGTATDASRIKRKYALIWPFA